ncbi:MAG: hypothetical protein V8Q88_08090 [Christensenellales bacterium]
MIKKPTLSCVGAQPGKDAFSGQKTHPEQNRRRLEVQRRFCLPNYA